MRARDISRDTIDEWMFDYWEGNLSPVERTAVEDFVRSNEEYAEEFQSWEKSYLEEAVETVLPEEARKLIKPVPGRKKGRDLIFDIAVLLMLAGLLFWPDAAKESTTMNRKDSETGRNNISAPIKEKNNLSPQTNVTTASVITSEAAREDSSEELHIKSFTTEISVSVKTDTVITLTEISKTDNTEVRALETTENKESLLPEIAPGSERNTAAVNTESKPQSAVDKKDKRKGNKEYNKAIRNNMNRRRASEFLKGDEPYVVEPNPNL